ncbi:MAG: hypothetical protein NW208_01695 [Bryobacter sp.]|nr:hypothetical protein [Bryobacter sp.]
MVAQTALRLLAKLVNDLKVNRSAPIIADQVLLTRSTLSLYIATLAEKGIVALLDDQSVRMRNSILSRGPRDYDTKSLADILAQSELNISIQEILPSIVQSAAALANTEKPLSIQQLFSRFDVVLARKQGDAPVANSYRKIFQAATPERCNEAYAATNNLAFQFLLAASACLVVPETPFGIANCIYAPMAFAAYMASYEITQSYCSAQ